MSDSEQQLEYLYQNLPAVTFSQLINFVTQPALLQRLTEQQIYDHKLEAILTRLRKQLLLDFDKQNTNARFIQILSALAIQCYLNEYVFYVSEQEQQVLNQFGNNHAALENEQQLLCLLLYACYKPLHEINSIATIKQRLRLRQEACIQEVVRVQVTEPLLEQEHQQTIPSLNRIDNGVSYKVSQHYEANPYPRWSYLEPITPLSLPEKLNNLFSTIATKKLNPRDANEILIAGCGTGKSIIENARRFPDSHIIAIDLSRKSLGFAKRMVDHFELNNVELFQADFLQLSPKWNQFDYIESVGVLSHLEDPLHGMQVLSDLLKPGGTMRLSLYNKNSRGFIDKVRNLIGNDYENDLTGVQQARQKILRKIDDDAVAKLIQLPDFYSLSECRDLLFHVHEKAVDIEYIQKASDKIKLHLLGFEPSKFDLQYVFWLFKQAASREKSNRAK